MNDVILLVQRTGRYPSSASTDGHERNLATWLRRRRHEAKHGTLAHTFRIGLDVLPQWQATPRSTADAARWQSRLEELAAYRCSDRDWPRHRAAETSQEHQLGVWIHTQRFMLRRGTLDTAKIQALDAAVPGWRAGRRCGRKPAQDG
ncbi:helicase associated domain-containing protein (plasmid) [Arthrobacter sp. FW305-BF8]|uniref:helicase associated domain-containing protein n=1 Tax=Arthrobacter sp. FW305-BF8 TaxID=2879617 RepID=UPI001F2F589B|nr:helicase associated domain-containing protein [Arthrobacter sp. FW305-BF8]UKA56625.1 helicase associated domain-containing protein [Arthrobacter sp. FW305-BF8]